MAGHIAKCIFLDRDGVINHDPGDYTWKLEEFIILKGVVEALAAFKQAGYRLVIITNQAGIAKGLYTEADVLACHDKMQRETGHLVDALYFSPYHPVATESLGRKPGSLLMEKAIARFGIDPGSSWMVGDKERDLIPAKKLGMRTILTPLNDEQQSEWADFIANSLLESSKLILGR